MKRFTDDDIKNALRVTGGNKTAAAKVLDVGLRNFKRRVKRMEAAGVELPSSVFPIVPDGHKLRGVSTLSKVVDPTTGEPVLQWVKTAADAQKREEQLRVALEALKSEVPRAKAVKGKSKLLPASLLNLYVLTDYHIGMYAWAEEAGDDWDGQIAEDLVTQWFNLAVEQAPDAQVAYLAQLGDFLHYDSLDAITPTSRHILDADTRAQHMVRLGLRVLRRAIEKLLQSHDKVVVLMAEGNHDLMASAWLREAFAMFYDKEPRVEVVTNPDPYYAMQWGKTGLFFHHGHLKKPEQIDRVFARKFREIYGAVEYAYGHMGHMHNKLVIESALMRIEQHATLAAADAYASRHGYMSDRNACVITYDKKFGEVARTVVSPSLVKALTA